MINQVNEILKYSYEEIKGSPLILKMLSIYSTLYLNGSQPGYCEICLKKYYSELKITGMTKAEKYEQIKNRTCIPDWNGLKFIPSKGDHFNSELMTDAEATEHLIDGRLKESHFKKLPDIYLEMTAPKKESKNVEQQKAEPKAKKTTAKKS